MGNKHDAPFQHSHGSPPPGLPATQPRAPTGGTSVIITATHNHPSAPVAPNTFRESLQRHQKAQNEYAYLEKITHFDEHTLRLLHNRFTSIDSTIKEDGMITLQEFSAVLGVPEESLLLRRFFDFMDKTEMGSLNFRNFAIAMSMLSAKARNTEKMELSFFLYDLNNDGYIDRSELRTMVVEALKQMEMPLNSEQIDTIVDRTFELSDLNNDGRIDYEEYCIFCKKNPRILQPFIIDVSKLIEYEQESRRKHRYSSSMEFKRTLHHGPVDITDGGGNKALGALKSKVAKGFMKIRNDKVVPVTSIHDPSDVLAELNSGGSSDEEDDDSSLSDGYTSSPDFRSNAANVAKGNPKHKPSRSLSTRFMGRKSHTLEIEGDTFFYSSADESEMKRKRRIRSKKGKKNKKRNRSKKSVKAHQSSNPVYSHSSNAPPPATLYRKKSADFLQNKMLRHKKKGAAAGSGSKKSHKKNKMFTIKKHKNTITTPSYPHNPTIPPINSNAAGVIAPTAPISISTAATTPTLSAVAALTDQSDMEYSPRPPPSATPVIDSLVAAAAAHSSAGGTAMQLTDEEEEDDAPFPLGKSSAGARTVPPSFKNKPFSM